MRQSLAAAFLLLSTVLFVIGCITFKIPEVKTEVPAVAKDCPVNNVKYIDDPEGVVLWACITQAGEPLTCFEFKSFVKYMSEHPSPKGNADAGPNFDL
jgi:hypothetical protein